MGCSPRRTIAALCCLLGAGALGACGEAAGGSAAKAATTTTAPSGLVAGTAVGGTGAGSSSGTVKEVADPQEANSFPAPASVHHAPAATPKKAGGAPA